MRRLYSILAIVVVLVSGIVFMAKYNKKYYSIYGDAMGYYVYLPATFIYGNLQDMDKLPTDPNLPEDLYRYTGNMKKTAAEAGYSHALTQYTYAVAALNTPFFLAAHVYEKAMGLPANGYTRSYHYALTFGGLVYTFLGCLIVYRILRRYFNKGPSLLAILLIVLGTHMFWFVFRQAGMSHIPLFFLYALIMQVTIRLHEQPRAWRFVLLGFLAGLVAIMRPTDVVCLFIPLFYGLHNKEGFRYKWLLIKDNLLPVIAAVVAFLLPFIPQLLYWKLVSGNYLVYSYGKQQFFWDNPKIIEGLFHFSNGWLPYAPAMIFALAGLLLYKKYKPWAPVMVVLLPVYIYIIYSWFCYNYINGLGSRPMLHVYPLLALPMAAFIQFVMSRGIIVKTAFAGISLLCIGIVLSLSKLMAQNKYRSEDANMAFYREMVFKDKLYYNAMLAYDLAEVQPDPDKLAPMGVLAYQDFNNPTSDHYLPDPQDSTTFIYQVRQDEEYFPAGIKLKYSKEKFKDCQWLRCSGRFMYTDYAENRQQIFVLGVKDATGQHKKWSGCKINTKVGISDNSCPHAGTDSLMIEHTEYWRWGTVYFYTKLPDNIAEGDEVYLDIWNMNMKQLFLDDFKIEMYK